MDNLCHKVDDLINATETNYKVQQSVDHKIDELEDKICKALIFEKFQVAKLMIDVVNFDMSDLYHDRMYLSSKKAEVFDLKKANDACISQDGYLVELEDNSERDFVLSFIEKIGGATDFAIGGNDVAEEGKFVYYHSGEPVPQKVTWLPGEPNDSLQNEDCMGFWYAKKGLNDIRCDRVVKYVCEIPLTC
ncbi:lectin C-type domain protein [Elysia marginata]|uniref:Lectin C-type domain protein n=1 Tax=Elysia marginata TaxID=1093978 RepID=A0AAV4ENH8_9GAST|nr:lectin C-type domain protein [Elysia marginata]